MGAVASGPPPWGKIVVLVAARLFTGTGGNRRRPEIRLSVLSFAPGARMELGSFEGFLGSYFL